jgi:hypothetical protein
MSRIFCVLFYFAFTTLVNGQATSPFNSARITAIIGSHLTFNFNSINKFSTGIEKSNRTTLGIHFVDSSASAVGGGGGASLFTGWKLTVKATDTEFTGSGNVNTLDLNVIQIEASPSLGDFTPATFSPWITLTNSKQTLVEYTTATMDVYSGSTQINISYRCGVDNKVAGNSDYYETELDFILEPMP